MKYLVADSAIIKKYVQIRIKTNTLSVFEQFATIRRLWFGTFEIEIAPFAKLNSAKFLPSR